MSALFRVFTILQGGEDPDDPGHLPPRRQLLLKVGNGVPHSVDIAVGYFYLSGFTGVADLLDSCPQRP